MVFCEHTNKSLALTLVQSTLYKERTSPSHGRSPVTLGLGGVTSTKLVTPCLRRFHLSGLRCYKDELTSL